MRSKPSYRVLDPGKRYGGFRAAWRLPGRRDVTLYWDAMANDEPTPLLYETRSAMNPGIYFSHLPRFRQADLRVEAVYTNIPNYLDGGGGLTDFSAHSFRQLHNSWQLEGSVTAERWHFPILKPGSQNVVTASFGVAFTPQYRSLK